MAISERTEPPSPRRRSEARAKGQVARSAQLTSVIVLLAGLLYVRWVGPAMVEQVRGLLAESFASLGRADLTAAELWPLAERLGLWLASFAGPPLALIAGAALVGGAGQVGVRVTLKPLSPDIGRLSPSAGLGRMLSARAAVDAARSIAEIGVVAYTVYVTLSGRLDELAALPMLDLRDAAGAAAGIVLDAALNATLALIAIAVADYAWQRYSHERSLRMTKQDVRDEAKETDNPELRSRVRARQREIASRRPASDASRATLVIVAPGRMAVALRYDPATMRAPIVVARGQRLAAERIERVAQEHGAPIFEDAELGRALFASSQIGAQIPPQHYTAVAEAMALASVRAPRSGPNRLETVPAAVGTGLQTPASVR